MQLFFSVAILTFGIGCAVVYFRKPSAQLRSHAPAFVGDRPWRRVGAGICAVLAVMFVIGVYVVDVPQRPAPYALYWLVMLGLVVWLFGLVVKDVAHTRRSLDRRGIERKTESNR